MIVGLGIDLCEVARIGALLERWGDRFSRKLFTPDERAYAGARARVAEHFAARFAAKEAALKALGVPSGLSWHELEVVSSIGGAPRLSLGGRAGEVAASLGVTRTHLALTHTADTAAAVVVLER